ncbi:hypothetical protein [Marinobacter sp.]|uniref:hypothetical protein n=1 Tax=Marinobacter sp. TaxID=50741 RepID=UPI00261ADA03|nr:hypothetical protein [Marinobacter sp.]
MTINSGAVDAGFPWQHDVFFELSRLLNAKLYVTSIDGVILLRDLAGGATIYQHRRFIVRYLNDLYQGLEDVYLLMEESNGYSAIDTRMVFENPPVLPIPEPTLAGALAAISHVNSLNGKPSRFAH